MKLIEQGTNLYNGKKREGRRNLADVRVLRVSDLTKKQLSPVAELIPSYEYLVGEPEQLHELRSVNVGDELVNVAVKKRADGKSIPRAMIAGITAHDLMSAIGPANFYYGNQIDFTRRVDCHHQVAEAVAGGKVELGFVSEIPHPLIEGVGVLLSTPLEMEGTSINVLGKVSSKLGRSI